MFVRCLAAFHASYTVKCRTVQCLLCLLLENVIWLFYDFSLSVNTLFDVISFSPPGCWKLACRLYVLLLFFISYFITFIKWFRSDHIWKSTGPVFAIFSGRTEAADDQSEISFLILSCTGGWANVGLCPASIFNCWVVCINLFLMSVVHSSD